MPRPQVRDEFTEFFNALCRRGKAITTARQYASTLRVFVNQNPTVLMREADFIQVFEELRTINPMKYVVVKSAWPHFVIFKEAKGVRIPTFEKKVETFEDITVPENVIEAIRVLHHHRIGIRLLVTLCWEHVDVRSLEKPIARPTGISIKAPKLKHNIEAPSAPLMVLWNYARGDKQRPHSDTPLAPYVPNSKTPIPLTVLQDRINEYDVMTDGEYAAYVRNITPPSAEVSAANYVPPDVKALAQKSRVEYEATKAAIVLDPNDVDDELDAREQDRKVNLSSIMAFDPDAD